LLAAHDEGSGAVVVNLVHICPLLDEVLTDAKQGGPQRTRIHERTGAIEAIVQNRSILNQALNGREGALHDRCIERGDASVEIVDICTCRLNEDCRHLEVPAVESDRKTSMPRPPFLLVDVGRELREVALVRLSREQAENLGDDAGSAGGEQKVEGVHWRGEREGGRSGQRGRVGEREGSVGLVGQREKEVERSEKRRRKEEEGRRTMKMKKNFFGWKEGGGTPAERERVRTTHTPS
jgi:hypothetical protein